MSSLTFSTPSDPQAPTTGQDLFRYCSSSTRKTHQWVWYAGGTAHPAWLLSTLRLLRNGSMHLGKPCPASRPRIPQL
ncbi:Ornithine decarboxylase antizyme 2 [Manis javanica]|nr:Ornithine decarboxylase antizyme 2 [Manis javanica]